MNFRTVSKIRTNIGRLFGVPLSWLVFGMSAILWPFAKEIRISCSRRLRFTFLCDFGGVVNVTSEAVLARARATFVKERITAKWLQGLKADELLWDVGANIGMMSIYAAVRQHARVVAFEPQPSNYAACVSNLIANGVEDRALVLPICLYRSSGLMQFALSSLDVGAAASTVIGVSVHASQTRQIAAIAMTADHVLSTYGLDIPRFIKLDVDGNELDILQGASKILGDARCREVLVEVADFEGKSASVEPIVALLEGHGFRVVEQEGYGNGFSNIVLRKS